MNDIMLKDIWQIKDVEDYKVHFGRKSGTTEPLDEWVDDRWKWTGWQEWRPNRDEFNRPWIFSLMDFYPETDRWLFGGVFRVVARHEGRHEGGYEVELEDLGAKFIGRLKLSSSYRSRPTRVNFENHYNSFVVSEILSEPWSGRTFPGYEDIDLPFRELETLIGKDKPDWKSALENVKGIYLITDTASGKRYVGKASGDQGIWARWSNYVATGHGGNTELRRLIGGRRGIEYARDNFRFVLLEHRAMRTSDEVVDMREQFWKGALQTLGKFGLNRN